MRPRIIYSRKLSRKLFTQILWISRRWDFKIVLKTNNSIEIKIESWFSFSIGFISFHVIPFHFSSFYFHFMLFHFIFISIFISFSLSFSIWFHMWFHFVSFRLEGCREPCNDSTPEELSGSLGNFFCKPTAEAMRKRCGSFAEAGTLISQSDRPAGEFLRFRQISAEAKSLRIRIMRKACGRRSGRFGIMLKFPAEAKRLENRI